MISALVLRLEEERRRTINHWRLWNEKSTSDFNTFCSWLSKSSISFILVFAIYRRLFITSLFKIFPAFDPITCCTIFLPPWYRTNAVWGWIQLAFRDGIFFFGAGPSAVAAAVFFKLFSFSTFDMLRRLMYYYGDDLFCTYLFTHHGTFGNMSIDCFYIC